MPQTTNHLKLPTSIHIVSVLISVFFTLFQAVYWLFIGIKWLFAPIMLVFNIFIAIPYGKFFVKLPLTLDTHSIDECKLPTSIWWHFKEVSLELARMGFEVGNYLEIRNFAPNINTFFMSMVNHEKNQGAGILILVPKKTRLEDTELPPEAIHSVEFTTYDSEKMIIDFTTQPTPDPFPFLKNRQRLFADDLPEFALYNLFDQFEKKTGCSLSATTLSQLYDNPATIIHSEYLMLVNHSLQQHFIKKAATNYTMTWKGAMTNGLRTVWPTSVWYKHKDQKKLSTIMEQAGIKVDKCWEYGGETLISHPLEAPLLSLDKALEHSKSLLNKHFSLPSKLESVDILNPEKDKPKLIFSFQTVELFPKRNAVVQGLVKIVIDNIDSQYQIHTENFGLGDSEDWGAEEWNEDICVQPLSENFNEYIGYKKVLEAVYQHDDYSPEAEIVDFRLSMADGHPLWFVYLDKGEDFAVEIAIDAKTGETVDY